MRFRILQIAAAAAISVALFWSVLFFGTHAAVWLLRWAADRHARVPLMVFMPFWVCIMSLLGTVIDRKKRTLPSRRRPRPVLNLQ